jgi:hypothetical protein
MKNLLAIFNKVERHQDIKDRVCKNREGMLDVLAQNIQGAKQCPVLLGQKCIGQFCEQFMQFFSVNAKGEKKEFWRCAHVETPHLLIEVNSNLLKIIKLLEEQKEKK